MASVFCLLELVVFLFARSCAVAAVRSLSLYVAFWVLSVITFCRRFSPLSSLGAALMPSLVRLRGKFAYGGVHSHLELERRCGLRLRQIRSANLLLGVFDVMSVAREEFDLEVSRDAATRWLALCGAAAPSMVFRWILSLDDLDDFCGPILAIRWAHLADHGRGLTDERLDEMFDALFPHVRIWPGPPPSDIASRRTWRKREGSTPRRRPKGVLRLWLDRQIRAGPQLPDLSPFVREYGPWPPGIVFPVVSSYEGLVANCGDVLDCVFAAAPCISLRDLSDALDRCNIVVSPHAWFLRDYVALRRAGCSSRELLAVVPERELGSCLADLLLHGADAAGAQRCALHRGVAISQRPLEYLRSDRGLANRGVRRVGKLEEIWSDDVLRNDLHRLLELHLVSAGVHRVCEQLLALRLVCLPFRRLRALLLGRFRCRGPAKNFGRLPAERCWRVVFAYIERCQAVAAYLELMDLLVVALSFALRFGPVFSVERNYALDTSGVLTCVALALSLGLLDASRLIRALL